MQPKVKKWLFRFLFFGITLFSLAALYIWLHYSPAGTTISSEEVAHIQLPHSMRSPAEHDSVWIRHNGKPYSIEVDNEKSDGALFYYGAHHYNDPDHPQIADITRKWEAFNPTVAFYEGRSSGFVYGPIFEKLSGLPEPALVHKLARENDIPLYTLEPSYEDEVLELLEKYTAEQLSLYFFLRVYTSEAGGQANESLAMDLLQKRTDVQGLRGSLNDLGDIDRVWQRDFPDEGDWRTLKGEPGYLHEISLSSRRIRGHHMVKILT